MKNNAYLVLRFGLAITFAWIAVLIFKDPVLWSGFLPFAFQQSLPVAPEAFMQGVAIFDLLIAAGLLIKQTIKYAAVLAALHLLGLVFTLGFSDISARDFGLFCAAVAVFLQAKSEV